LVAEADRDQSRTLPPAVVEALLATKETNPRLSVQLVIREARRRPEVPADLPLPPSTVHRLLTRHGLMDPPPAGAAGQDADRHRQGGHRPHPGAQAAAGAGRDDAPGCRDGKPGCGLPACRTPAGESQGCGIGEHRCWRQEPGREGPGPVRREARVRAER
jgi:hypothetical protein